MNERIRELAESCTVDFVDGRGVSLSEIDVEKFALLIVRECANINYNSPFQDGEFHAREVLEHFGVES